MLGNPFSPDYARARDARPGAVDALGYSDDGIVHVTLRYGYMEPTDVPAALAALDPAAGLPGPEPDPEVPEAGEVPDLVEAVALARTAPTPR